MSKEENEINILVKQARTEYWEENGRIPTTKELLFSLADEGMLL